jgi:hypothetical protein
MLSVTQENAQLGFQVSKAGGFFLLPVSVYRHAKV